MSDHDRDARALIELYDERVKMTTALAAKVRPTSADYDAVFTRSDALDAACEAFRRRYYPRRARVMVGLWAAYTASATGRSVRTVLDLSREYRPERTAS